MSDEEHEQHHHGFIIPMPEDVRRHIDQAQMEQMTIRHEVNSFLYGLSLDDTRHLRTLLAACKDDPPYTSYIEGQLTGILTLKYNICPACGKDHDKELLDMPAADAESMPVNDGTEQLELDFSAAPTVSDSEIAEHMEKWGVRPPNDDDFRAGLIMMPDEKPVFCLGCGMLYQSLEDRMLRRPGIDGCFGCQQKSAHG